MNKKWGCSFELIVDIFYPLTSDFGMRNDTPVLEVELDVDEMAKSHKAWNIFPKKH